MSSESSRITSETTMIKEDYGLELTLGLPGVLRAKKRRLSSDDHSDTDCSSDAKRHSPQKTSKLKFVKVAVDGAPYLRKVDLESYASYKQLLRTLEHLFSRFSIENVGKKKKLMDLVKKGEFVATYEDNDGDWMLVGDVPWKMFVDTCKRIRLMRSPEASNGIVTNSNFSFSSS